MIETRETGATNVSLIKPNCLSKTKEAPLNVAVKITVIAIIPGAKTGYNFPAQPVHRLIQNHTPKLLKIVMAELKKPPS